MRFNIKDDEELPQPLPLMALGAGFGIGFWFSFWFIALLAYFAISTVRRFGGFPWP